ncbi:hypothetical protein FSARC_7054 [Fusarium sarcochroum]|uniref:Ankyrin n=1 Tax=Fusarium sarcochroum TaxID=1208366 RepID=A0A8H4TVZ7_9HYPO|nr:hypothetical protein FSARC_7054 [Fusarium sarcochroum]
MDPLSVSASVAGLVTLADLVFRATLKYSKSVRGAPKEVKDLLNEIKDLSLLLHNLSMVAFGLELQPDPQSGAMPPKPYHLHECRQLLRRLEEGLPKFEGQSSLDKLQSRLKWPFSTSETKEMLHAVSRHKQTINIALAADSVSKLQLCLTRQEETGKGIQQLEREVRKVQDIQTRISLNQKRKDILNTFIKANPRNEFEINKSLRHPMTALWLTESTDFEDWFSTQQARIWCSGIPGAGKSVIASAIIDECLQRTLNNPGAAVGYFFCTYRDSLTTLPRNILSALCYQLALQSEAAYLLLEVCYDELHSGHQLSAQADISRLMEVLHQMCATFDRVYLVVDGLDECGANTEEIVDSLLSIGLAATNTNTNLGLLSRDEVLIRERVEPHFHWVEIEAHTQDIQLYVASELDRLISSKKLRLKDTTLKDEIMGRVVKGARGMFRWVTCQLAHLCELPTDRARRNALERLPPTLPATYERVRLNGDSRALCEAIYITDYSDRLDEDEIVDEQEVLRWCGCLVRMSPNPSNDGQRLEFAHYTVQEFLETDCINHPTLNIYGTSRTKADDLFMRLSLRFLTLKNFEVLPRADGNKVQHIQEMRQHRPFYEAASIFWLTETFIEADESALNLIYMLFHIKKTPNFCTWAVEVIRHCLIEHDDDSFSFDIRPDFGRNADIAGQVISAVLRPDFTPLHMAAAWGLTNVCRLSVFADVDISSTELHSNTIGELQRHGCLPAERRNTVQLLLNAGAQVDSLLHTPFKSSSLLSLVVFSSNYGHDFRRVSDLIQNGVVVDKEDLPSFDWTYRFARKVYKPDEFKQKHAGGQAILDLLETLGHDQLPETSRRAEVKLYHKTLQFANQMELDVPATLVEPPIDNGMSDEDLRTFVYSAIKDNNVDLLEKFASCQRREVVQLRGLNPDKPDWTPIHVAVDEWSLDSLKVLLDWGCDPNAQATDGRTPLNLCSHDKHEEFLRTLVQRGASTTTLDHNSETIWHSSAEVNATRILKTLLQLDEGHSSLQMVSGAGDTPICRALAFGHEQSTMLLLEFCDTKQHWKSIGSTYRAAAELGLSKVLQKLLNVGVEPDGVDENTGNPLHFLNTSSEIQCAEHLKTIFSCDQRRKDDSATPFEALLKRGFKWSWMEYIHTWLLERGIANHFEEHSGTSALSPLATGLCRRSTERLNSVKKLEEGFPYFQGWNWFSETFTRLVRDTKYKSKMASESIMTLLLCEAIIHDDQNMVELLLEAGVDCHRKVDMITPFQLACLPNFSEQGKVLGCLLRYTDTDYLTQPCSFMNMCGPLHLAAGFKGWGTARSLDKTHRLLQAGANPNLPSYTIPPIVDHIMRGSMETAELLLDFGADPWLRGSYPFDAALAAIASHNSLFLAKIAEHSTLSKIPFQYSRTLTFRIGNEVYRNANALHLAAHYDEVECLNFYINGQHLTDLEVEDGNQETPMHYAARFGSVSAIKLLVDRGGNIDARSASGMTPLHLAVQRQHVECVMTLLNQGAVHQTCDAGCSPLIYAYEAGNAAIIKALQTPLSSSAASPSVVKLKGVRKMAVSLQMAIQRSDIDACQRICALGCTVDAEMPSRMTPLTFAICQQDSVELVQWLLDNNAKASTRMWDKPSGLYLTVCHIALMYPVFNPLLSTLLTKYLDEGGEFSIHEKNPLVIAIESHNIEGLLEFLKTLKNSRQSTHFDKHGRAGPLHLAARYDDLAALRALVDSGADLEGLDSYRLTPLHMAAKHEASSIARYLITQGGTMPFAL